MEIFDRGTAPMYSLHIDFFGPLEETADKFRHILVVVDAYTKYVWLYPCKTTASDKAIECLTSLFNLFGFPERLISDRGTAFTSKNFENFVKENGIVHNLTAVASPWANGQVERVNRFLKSTLAKICEESVNWKIKLGKVQFVLNNTLHKSITPSKLLLGYE